MGHDTIPLRLLERAHQRPDDTAYYVKRDDVWQGTSWSTYAGFVARAAKALIALGVAPGNCIGLSTESAPEWAILQLGAMSIGARAVGLYPAAAPDEQLRILAHADARLVLVANTVLLAKLRAASTPHPALDRAITVDDLPDDTSAEGVMSFSAFLALGERVSDPALASRRDAVRPDDVAALVYTGGVEGPPRGVLLSHQNLTFTADAARTVLRIGAADSSLAYLPLAHAAEQLATLYCPITSGHAVYYAESARHAYENLAEIQPTLVFGVPRAWEQLRARIAPTLAHVRGARGRTLSWAQSAATRVVQARSEGKEPPVDLALSYELARPLVLDQLTRAMGLGRARVCVSAGGTLDQATLTFYASLGIQLLELYGQTETGGAIAINQRRRARLGSAGPRLPGTEVQVAEDGEILVRGPHVFVGYHADPKATAKVLVGDTLHTGDAGRIDAEGFLTVLGKKRELLVLQGGKTVAPERLEAALRGEPLIHDAVVVGHRRRFLSVLVSIDEQVAAELGLSADLHENEIVRQRVDDQVRLVNARDARAEPIKQFFILPRRLGVARGELAHSGKLRRARVEELWAKEIAALYAEEEPGQPATQRTN